MARKLAIGSLLAALVLFVWGFLAWAMLADVLGIVRPLPNEEAVLSALAENVPETGVYFYPAQRYGGTEAEQAAWMARHAAGPLGLMFYRYPGVEFSMVQLLWGFLHFWVAASLAGLLLVVAPLGEYGRRVKLLVAAAAFAAVALHVSPSIWWYAPWSFSCYSVVTTVIGWSLGALVLARFVRPE